MNGMHQFTIEELEKSCEIMPVPIIVFDRENIYVVNERFVQLLGFSKEELLGDNWLSANMVRGRKFFQNKIAQLFDNLVDFDHEEMELFRKNRESVWARLNIKLISLEHKDVLLVTFSDVTEEKITQHNLNRYIHLRQSLLELTQSVIDDSDIEEVYEKILSAAVSNIEGAEIGSVMVADGNNLKIVACVGLDKSKTIGTVFTCEELYGYKASKGKLDGTVIINDIKEVEGEYNVFIEPMNDYLRSSIASPIFIEGEFFGMINVDSNRTHQFDETDRVTMEYLRTHIAVAIKKHFFMNEKVYLSTHDGLTDLYNRSHFERVIIDLLGEMDEHTSAFIVMFDLDYLKCINDTYGHIVGDKMITWFTKYLATIKLEGDIIARYGGDEFIALLNRESKEVLQNDIEGLRDYLKNNPIKYNQHDIYVSFSYGIATVGRDSMQYRQLVRIADSRMYVYKKKNKRELD